jgi:hypothetical protein
VDGITLNRKMERYNKSNIERIIDLENKVDKLILCGVIEMTNDEFCKIDNAFYGNAVDNIKQIKLRSFNGEELKEYVEAAINYTQ